VVGAGQTIIFAGYAKLIKALAKTIGAGLSSNLV
jgi:hypothetical protein